MAGAALPIPTKTGYTFAGWYENQEFSGDPVTDVPTDSTKNLNFYAKWTANTYTVIFDANGGSVNPNQRRDCGWKTDKPAYSDLRWL